ncbi:ABC transporter permease [Nocardioides sp. CER19]|uniref:ABC transporter permease n=1 Tax=Nocardioides sp. CER19 TaxID=3038538 RepID=UPI00244BCCAF|nr:ABC transporter permease [Nocardioides sp. CER19]MDH2413778.1 ABC transporter permease [Nocardioides sp. CER19]
MHGNAVSLGWPLTALLVFFALTAASVTRLATLGDWRAPLTAAVRCVVQLAAVSLVIRFAIESMAWTVVFVGGMIAVAAATSARRVTGSLRAAPWMATPILAGVVPAIGLALASTAVPAKPIAVLPTAGILVGGAMSAATLAGRRATDELTSQHGQYDAALALGLTRRQAVGIVARSAAGLALVPGLDQTRTVGLVTLPGAFVGVLLTGASPLQAGVAQAFVLISLLAVQAVSAAVTIELVASARTLPARLELRQ